MRVDRGTFELILNRISANIYKTPTKMESNLFRYQQGQLSTFNKVFREMISQHFNEYVYMPRCEEEQIAECKGYIENYKFPYVSEWNGFHVYVSIHLKNYYSFKNMYAITNMGLIDYNKRFVALRASAPGSNMMHVYLPAQTFSKILLQEMLYLTKL